jgi:hypothetical protein
MAKLKPAMAIGSRWSGLVTLVIVMIGLLGLLGVDSSGARIYQRAQRPDSRR